MKKITHQLMWLAAMTIPPIMYVGYELAKSIQTYDGHCKAILEVGPECSPLEFVINELTHPFVLPYIVFVFFGWVVLVGLLYFAIKIAASKPVNNPQHNHAIKADEK